MRGRGINRWGSGGKPRPDLPPLVAPADLVGSLPRGNIPPEADAARKVLSERRLAFVTQARDQGYRDKDIRDALGLVPSTFYSYLTAHGLPGRRRYNYERANERR